MNRNTLRIHALAAAALLAPVLVLAQAPFDYTISTVAGNGTAGYSGDGSTAASAQLSGPCGLLLDKSGTLYIADQLNSRIRKVGSDGNISTVAGNGTASYTGDGGAATSATISHPCGMVIDSSGNIYFADTTSSVVRKFAPGGNISTVAGSQSTGYGGDGGAATGAVLNSPRDLARDAAGNLYIADSANQIIRMVDTKGNINLVAGVVGNTGRSGDGGAATGALLNNPQGLALDGSGNLYIADTNNSLIRKVSTDGTITTVAGNGTKGFSGDGGPALKAALNYPRGIVFDAAGNLFIADSYNSRIRVMTPNGTIWTVAGNGQFGYTGDGGSATKAQFRFPSGLALDGAGNLYVADSQNNVIRLLTLVPRPPVAAPVIGSGGVVGAGAFGGFTTVAPGSWVEIYGSNLAGNSRAWAAADFKGSAAPTSLDGTSVAIGGQAAFLSYISPGQVNVQLPSNLASGQQQLTVTTAGGTSAPITVNIAATQPGLLAPAAFQVSGRQYTGALFLDGKTYVLPSGAVSGVTSRPARAGETIVLYGVGFGPVTPGVDAGTVAQQTNQTAAPVEILFGQTPATVSYAGLAVGAVGLYQFNVVVPNVAAADAVPLTVNLGGVKATQTLYTAVGQ